MFGRRTKAKAAGKAALAAGKAGGAGKTLLKSRAPRGAVRGGGKAAGKAALGAGKVGGGAGGTLLKSRAARRATGGVGKKALKGGIRAVTPKEPATTRFLKYGFFALAGFAIGALVARSGEKEVSPSFTGETLGMGTPPGTAGAGLASDPARPQRPEDPNRTGAEREYSDPSSGPLIGRSHPSEPPPDIPEQQEEVEQRIRSRVGTDPRTTAVPRLNVEVNDGVVDLRGEVHSEDERAAVEEIAADTEGVDEVRNLLTVNPQSPTRHRQAGGEPDQP
ncbi:MAG: BON domain-containing protein [Actinomycetota bacterium]|nr:BON domain-containing protein [Actinomycetota bacterium]